MDKSSRQLDKSSFLYFFEEKLKKTNKIFADERRGGQGENVIKEKMKWES